MFTTAGPVLATRRVKSGSPLFAVVPAPRGAASDVFGASAGTFGAGGPQAASTAAMTIKDKRLNMVLLPGGSMTPRKGDTRPEQTVVS